MESKDFCGACLRELSLSSLVWISPGLFHCWDCQTKGTRTKLFVVASPHGSRIWHADDEDHAVEQHRMDFEEEPVLHVYEVEHPENCECGG